MRRNTRRILGSCGVVLAGCLAVAGCLAGGGVDAIPPSRQWHAVFAGSGDDAGRTVLVRRGDEVVVDASARASVVVTVRDVGGGVVGSQSGPEAVVRHVASASGRVRVDIRPVSGGGITAGDRPAPGRMMIAVEPPVVFGGDGGDDQTDGAAWLTRREHLLVSLFGVNPARLHSRTGLALSRALDAMAVYGRRTDTRRGEAMIEDGGHRFARTVATDGDDGHSAGGSRGRRIEVRHAIDTGRETLVMVTRYEPATGQLLCELTLTTTDGARVDAALAVRLPPAVELPAVPASDPVGDYLATDPDAASRRVDDFGDLAGEAPVRDEGGASEGVVSFVKGAVAGDWADNDSWSALGGQTAIGLVPIAGQVADVRDILAAGAGVWDGDEGGWATLGIAVVAVIPGLDFLKGTTRASRKTLRAASETAIDRASRRTLRRVAKVISKRAARRAEAELKLLNAGRAELLARLNHLLVDDALTEATKNSLRRGRNALRQHLTPADLAGALRDRLGVPVRQRGTGRAFDHYREVDDAVNALDRTWDNLERVQRGLTPGSARYRAISREMDALAEMTRRVRQFIKIH